MKTIEPIQIWNNGQLKTASVLDSYAVNVELNKNAKFYYSLLSLKNGLLDETLSEGFLSMNSLEYEQWQTDDYAWDFISNNLNLTITGDFTPPQNIEQPVENNPENL